MTSPVRPLNTRPARPIRTGDERATTGSRPAAMQRLIIALLAAGLPITLLLDATAGPAR